MPQTDATKRALLRDENECQYHKWILGSRVDIFHYQPKRHHYLLAGGHHCFGRARVDETETIITLCADCHGDVEAAKISKMVIVALLSSIVGVDLFQKYRSFCKWSESDWDKVYP